MRTGARPASARGPGRVRHADRLAFQIQDDLLDVLGERSTLGKATGADSERAKPTHPAVIGIEALPGAGPPAACTGARIAAAVGARAERCAPRDWLLSRRY